MAAWFGHEAVDHESMLLVCVLTKGRMLDVVDKSPRDLTVKARPRPAPWRPQNADYFVDGNEPCGAQYDTVRRLATGVFVSANTGKIRPVGTVAFKIKEACAERSPEEEVRPLRTCLPPPQCLLSSTDCLCVFPAPEDHGSEGEQTVPPPHHALGERLLPAVHAVCLQR